MRGLFQVWNLKRRLIVPLIQRGRAMLFSLLPLMDPDRLQASSGLTDDSPTLSLITVGRRRELLLPWPDTVPRADHSIPCTYVPNLTSR